MNLLAKKLLIKPGKDWLFYNAPNNYFSILEPLPENVTLFYNASKPFDGVQLFVKNVAELAESLKFIAPVLKPDTIFWITYPKKSSGIESDLEMMGSWAEVEKYGLRIVASAAIDQTWTALRFRPQVLVKTSEGRNDNVRHNEYSAYVDVDNKQVKLPPVIADALATQPKAMEFYQQLSYSNKKEYVLWVITAKQEKTRSERLGKLVEKLNGGKKNPSEK